jgi:hypothetical protein
MARPATAAVRLLTGEREPVRLATTGPIDVDAGGLLTIDGIVTAVGDRVLVKDQTDGSENGIRTVSTGQWYRAADARTSRTMQKGTTVHVQEGTVNVDKVFRFNTLNPVIGDDALVISEDTIVGGVTPGAAGLAILADATVADVRDDLDTPVYVTRAQMILLDTAKDQLAYVTDYSFEGLFRWIGTDLSAWTVIQTLTSTGVTPAADTVTIPAHGLSTASGFVLTSATANLAANTAYYAIYVDVNNIKVATTPQNAIAGTAIDLTVTTNFTLKRLTDPQQDIFVIKTGGQLDGSTGGWVKPQGMKNIGVTTPNFHRFNDRILVGGGATRWMGDKTDLYASGAGSWLLDEQGAGSAFNMSYLLVGAQVASVPDYTPGMAVLGNLGAVRTPSGASNAQVIGKSGYGSGWATSGSSIVWGDYTEGVKRPGSNATVSGMEVEVTNLNSTPVNPVMSPEAAYVQGRTFGLFIGSGGSNAAPYDADIALWFGPNGAKFRTGIGFHSGSLTKDVTTDYQHAIMLPSKARVEWYTSDLAGNYAFTIHSEVSDSAHSQYAIASDTGFAIANVAGSNLFRVAWGAGAQNGYTIITQASGTSPMIWPTGGDANLDFIARGKGTGGGSLQDGASGFKFRWNTVGIGFNGTTPVAAPTGWGVPTGTLLRTTYASYAGATHTGAYVQATIQALDDATKAVSQRLAALITDLHQTAGYGLLRT